MWVVVTNAPCKIFMVRVVGVLLLAGIIYIIWISVRPCFYRVFAVIADM